MLNWLRNNLFNRWSFNLLIWHGLRMILRIAAIYILDFVNHTFFYGRFSEYYDTVLFYAYPFVQAFVIFPPIIVFFLERKKGFRFTPKFFQNNLLFIFYLLLAIPALIVEAITLCILTYIFAMSLFDNLIIIFTPHELLDTILFILNPFTLLWLITFML